MSLDWDKLRVFHAAAEAGSFTHAAETLRLSQSAISRQVSALEHDVGVPLFHRHARGLVLTEQGEMLFRTAHDVLMKLEAIKTRLTEAKDRPSGVLRVTTTVGLGQALARIGKRAAVAVREPSMGPIFGVKGGGCGGGRSQVLPMEDINLHFTGDIHAVSAAHNLLAAMMDNALYHKQTELDPANVRWRRALDVNDRSLRQISIGKGGRTMGVPRQCGFDIAAASEVMAILCLARDAADLVERLSRILLGYTTKGHPVRAADIQAAHAMAIVLNAQDAPHARTMDTPAIAD